MPKITLPDGSERQFDAAVSGADVAASIGAGLAKAAVAVRVDGALWDLNRSIEDDVQLEILTRDSDDGLELLRHDAAHVLAEAVKELWPDTQVTIGPAIDNGVMETPDEMMVVLTQPDECQSQQRCQREIEAFVLILLKECSKSFCLHGFIVS